MTFPNAFRGVKKIFLAEVLMLLSVVFLFLSSVTAIISFNFFRDDTAPIVFVALALTVASGILALVAYIIKLVGVSIASRDDGNFKISFWASIVCIVLSVPYIVFSGYETFSNLMDVLIALANLFAAVFVLQGIRSLSVKLDDPGLKKRSELLIRIITIVALLEVAASMLVMIFNSEAFTVAADVIDIVASLLSAVQFILYLVFLSKAKAALSAG